MVKNPPVNTGGAGDVGSIPGSGRSPGVGKWQPTLVFLPGEFRGQRNLVGYSPSDLKESDMAEKLSTHRHRMPYLSFFPFLLKYAL